MFKSDEWWSRFEKSGDITDYLKFKGACDGQGDKNTGAGNSYQRL